MMRIIASIKLLKPTFTCCAGALLLGGPASAAAVPADRIANIKSQLAVLERRGGGQVVPEFPSGLTWFNAPPLSIGRELRGRVLVLDFWTYCCINCIHVLPDLASIEEQFADQARTPPVGTA